MSMAKKLSNERHTLSASKKAISVIVSVILAMPLIPLAFAPLTPAAADEAVSENAALAANTPSLSKTSVSIDGNSYEAMWTTVNVLGLGKNDSIDATSSNESIVIVSAEGDCIGLTAIGAGTAIVTVTVRDSNSQGVKATLALKVTVSSFKVSSSKAVGNSMVLYKGESGKLTVKGPSAKGKITFSSSNKKVASVSTSGKVLGRGCGNANIIIRSGDALTTFPVSVGTKKGVKAARWAAKNVRKAKYSQSKRMKKGYFDCSSLTGRAYATQGMTLGGSKAWSSTAATQAKWCKKKQRVVFEQSNDIDTSQLIPGDLIFFRLDYAGVNREYRHIDHVAMYVGGGKVADAAFGFTDVSTSGAIMVGRPTQYATPVPMASGVTAKKSTSTSVKVSWKKKSGVTGYKIYRSEGDLNFNLKEIATVKGASKKSYIDKNLTPGMKYNYQIRAYKKSRGKIFLGRMQHYKNAERPLLKTVRL